MPSTPFVHGRRPRVSLGVVGASVLVAVALFALSVVAARFVVYDGTELTALVTLLALGGATAASRAGGSLLAAVVTVFVPNATLVLFTVPGVGDAASLVVAIGTAVYVAGGVAVPGGMLAYAVGVRWRTGPWEASLWDHLGADAPRASLLLGWTVGAGVLVLGSIVAPDLVSLGVVQFGLLVGALLVATRVGWRALGVDTAVGVGLVAAALVAVGWSFGIIPGPDATLRAAGRVALFAAAVALLVGAPVGLVGYAAGRGVRADAVTTANAEGRAA